ncbi:MerR family transcriptional regulator [Clostridium estertheticum]|uniref:MerR family transcriptional regulator n=1 Tax=Clostridium estertheticum TaxID=238834 RepID=UPI001C0BB93E|nr:MerR family transcriptional regulator [Clostridium estertheticum]MBU3075405.1 MerR family transcriptional regulator [Clostridium estertheticum]MBU3165576.1 MerR family transcriptional regulator [Clostridium estertheticum]
MFRIGEFSKLTKTTVKALRYYDEIDLLKPEFVDEETNYRVYTTKQLVKLHKIQSFRQIGLSIDEIKLIISGHSIKLILEKRKSEIEDTIAQSNAQLSRIEFILQGKEDELIMNYQAILKELPECIVYSKRLTVSSYDSYFELIPAIEEEIVAANPELKCTVPEYCFIKYLDNEYKVKDINIEFCEAVEKMGKETGDIKFRKIESVSAVSVMHKGGYARLAKAYAFAFKWSEDNGYVIVDSPRENYIDGIWNKENEDEWLTELQIPLIKK